MDEKRLVKLEERISKLEVKPKDKWDRANIIGAFLIPLAIAYTGHRFAVTQQATTLEAEERQSRREHELAQVNLKVSQAGLIASMLDALLSTDEKRQKLATEAVLIAMPETGPALVKVVSKSDSSSEIRNFAIEALLRRRTTLIGDLFAETPARRSEAYNGLIAGWSEDSTIITELIAYAYQNRSNANGVNNVLIFLSHMDRNALRPYINDIEKFTYEMETIGSRTQERGEILRSRLPK